MRDYQSPVTIRAYIVIALPLMIFFLAPYFAQLLSQHEDIGRQVLLFLLGNTVIFVTILLISVQVLPPHRRRRGYGGPCSGAWPGMHSKGRGLGGGPRGG